MRFARRMLTLILAIACLATISVSHAKKPTEPPGGGGGGNDTPPRYQVLELTGFNGSPSDISEASPDADFVWVSGTGDEAGYVAAMYGIVTPALDVATGYLPEPRIPLNGGLGTHIYGDTFNRASEARAVNNHGDIAGGCDFYDPGASAREYSEFRATQWVNTPGGYERADLGLASPTHNISVATDINDQGLVVGASGFVDFGNEGYETFYRAILWGPGEPALDLNDLLPVGSPWELWAANSINEQGQICGEGMLDGITRGFVLDLTNNEVVAVPVLPGGAENLALDINEAGEVTGWSRTLDVSGNLVVRRAYLWTGTGAAVDLGSTTGEVSYGHGLNDWGDVVGESQFADDPIFSQSATYWHRGTGEILQLDSEIPSKPRWILRWASAINNQGWIVVDGAKNERGSKWYQTAALLIPN